MGTERWGITVAEWQTPSLQVGFSPQQVTAARWLSRSFSGYLPLPPREPGVGTPSSKPMSKVMLF